MKSLRFKIIATYTGVSFVILTLMRLFHGSYVLYYKDYLLTGLGSFLPIVLSIMIISALYVIKIGRSLDRIWKKSLDNKEISIKEKEIALDIISRIPTIIFIINVLGFLVGPTVSIIVKLKGAPFFTLPNILTVLYNMGLGMVGSLFEIKVIDYFLTKPRESLNLYFLKDDQKLGSSNKLIILVVAACFYLISVMFISATTGYLVNGSKVISPMEFIPKVIMLGVMLTVLLLPIVFSYTSYITSIVNLITKKVQAITSGEGDLSVRMSIIQFDEFGMLTDSINRYLDNLKDLLIKIHDTHGKVSEVSLEMYDDSVKIGESLKAISEKSKNVEQASISQLNLVNNADDSINQVVSSVSVISNSLKDQSDFVTESSAAIEQMVSNISSVTSIAQRANDKSIELKDVSEQGEIAVKDTAKAFKEVEQASEEMKGVISLISKIAAQTNLLAMNAAIEAAHAGEAGKGFAVVADEVRKLAFDSGTSIKKIVELIKGMNEKIHKGVTLSNDAEVSFHKISTDVTATTELIKTISAAMAEQSQGANEVLSSISSLVEGAKGIEIKSEEQKRDSKEIEKSIHELTNHSVKITKIIEDQNSSFSEINNLSECIVELTKTNSIAVEELQDSISKFRF